MRTLFALLATASAFAQLPTLSLSKPPLATERRVETALGQVAILNDKTPLPLGERLALGDAPLVAGQADLMIPASAVDSFTSGIALARYLSHVRAHQELGHAEKLDQAARLRMLSPHIPDKYSQVDRDAMEAEAVKRGDEIFQATDCATGSCAAFDEALAAMKEALLTLP